MGDEKTKKTLPPQLSLFMSDSNKEQQSEILKSLKERVDYFDAPNSDGTPSPCAIQCSAQQQALVDCVNQIKDDPNNQKTKECLQPAAQAWITCCSEANTFANIESASQQ